MRALSSSLSLGSWKNPHDSVHQALEQSRLLRKQLAGNKSYFYPKIILRQGIHSLDGQTIQLHEKDDGLSIIGYPDEDVWISGGLPLDVSFHPQENTSHDYQSEHGDNVTYVANLTDWFLAHKIMDLPHIMSLFTTTRRYIRARYPNGDPEIDQWGYASPQRLDYSISSDLVEKWHKPPPSDGSIDFTFFDFQTDPPPGVPHKNDSSMIGYNWYASGKGGACSDVWGPLADSYWCSNASQGGWAEVDRECAMSGQMQLPVGMTYYNTNKTDTREHSLDRFDHVNLTGGFVHAWHSQSWAMHMFEILHNEPSQMVFAKGGGRQGGRNWCRCDQCTYAAGWCGQHQTPQNNSDTRLIGGTWMVENVLSELDQDGEYYFDRDSKLLFVKPNTTLDLSDFRLGILEQLVVFQNTTNITIENIGFRDTVPTYMAEDWSAPSGGDWALHRGGAVFLENVSQIAIRNCLFWRLDGNAIFLSKRTRNVTIEHNRFEWLGENAIATWGETKDYDGTEGNFPMYTLIQYNVMRELGIYQKQSSAVGQCKAARTTIRKNIMFNMPRAAINMNDMLGGGDIIEQNLIFNTCRESGDHGPINSWDRQAFLTTLRDGVTKSFDPLPRTIQDNFIIANYGASQGVDNDDGSSWYHILHNLFYSAEGFKMDYGGHDSVYEGNLVMSFPYSGNQCYNMGSFLEGHGDILRGNKCLVGLGNHMVNGCGDPSCSDDSPDTDDDDKHSIGGFWSSCEGSHLTLAENEYFTPDGKAFVSCGGGGNLYSLQEMQDKFGLEVDSQVTMLPSEDTILAWVGSMIQQQLKTPGTVPIKV